MMSPETLTRLAGAMTEFSTAWAADVDALRTVEAELSTTTTLLNTANMRREDLQADLDAALANNKLLLDRNAYLEAQIMLIADRAQDAEHGMAAVRQRVDATVRGDGTTRDRVSAPVAPVERLAKLVREIETTQPAAVAAAAPEQPRQVREIAADQPDGTELPQEPPPIVRRTMPPANDFIRHAAAQ
ncbi:hypothetical protein ACIPUD_11125 [Bradyrhizobium sp. CAR08]